MKNIDLSDNKLKSDKVNRQKRLIECLSRLSETIISENECDNYYKILFEIYDSQQFRHSYSEITTLVIELYETPESDSLETLITNLKSVYEYCEYSARDEDFVRKVYKLYDHVNLETIRCRSYSKNKEISENLSKQLSFANKQLKTTLESTDTASQLKSVGQKILEAKESINNSRKEVKDLQGQVIAVLGIFSAVVITFFGGFSYFTSVFNNIEKVSIWHSLLVAGVLGFVIFNTISILLLIVAILVGRPIKLLGMKNNIEKDDTYNWLGVLYISCNAFIVLISIVSGIMLIIK
jgi:hypothetical protein